MDERQKFIAEMKRIQEEMHKTKSQYLRRDYRIALKEMQKDLADYDAFHKGAK